MSFQGVELPVGYQCVLHAVLHTHLRALGGSLVLGHVRSAAHRIGDDSRKRLLLRNCSKRSRKRQREYCSQFCFGLHCCFSLVIGLLHQTTWCPPLSLPSRGQPLVELSVSERKVPSRNAR